MLIISALGRPRQEDHKFDSSLGYIECPKVSVGYVVRPCLERKKWGEEGRKKRREREIGRKEDKNPKFLR
jgi:hypothetical protein